MSLLYNKNLPETAQPKHNTIISSLRPYLFAALLLTQSSQVQSIAKYRDTEGFKEEKVNESIAPSIETKEVLLSYDNVFKAGVIKTLSWINNLSQIPTGGKVIEYVRDNGPKKGKKMTPENIKTFHLPDKIDISPKQFSKAVSSMNITLGNRKFTVAPDIWNIKTVYLTTDKLVIETTVYIDIAYDKTKKLPDLMLKLSRTPAGKWEKKWFRMATVKEI